MTNNEIFNTLLHLTGLGVNKQLLIKIFALESLQVTKSQIKGWSTIIDDNRASSMPDWILRGFLQGLFKYRNLKNKEGISIFEHLHKGKL